MKDFLKKRQHELWDNMSDEGWSDDELMLMNHCYGLVREKFDEMPLHPKNTRRVEILESLIIAFLSNLRDLDKLDLIDQGIQRMMVKA